MTETFLGLLAFAAGLAAAPMRWPTPLPPPAPGESHELWAQPTQSGDPISALFGCVRNDGDKFHEGIDIAPIEERVRGEATDPILAAWDGVVVHVNTSVKDSGYGRYVVVEHRQFRPVLVTLYAHLASVDAGVRPGTRLAAGQRMGVMGRSAGGYSIPPERAHLHFEIALRLSDDFQSWYDAQGYDSKNEHGIWNGMNLIGLDPWAAWQWLQAAPGRDIGAFFQTQPTAFIAELSTREVPDIVRRSPDLLTAPLPPGGVAGWRVEVTGWGMPLRFTPLAEAPAAKAGTVRIVAVDPGQIAAWTCRDLVSYRDGVARLEPRGRLFFELLFTFDLD